MAEQSDAKPLKPLVLLAVAGAAGWLGWESWQRFMVIPDQVHQAAVQSHFAMQATVEQAYNGKQSYAAEGGDILAYLRGENAIVASIRVGDEPDIPLWKPFDYWQGNITGITAAAEGDQYRLEYSNVPQAACRHLLTEIKGREGGPFQGVAPSAAATEPAYLAPLDATVATATCRGMTTDLAFFYR